MEDNDSYLHNGSLGFNISNEHFFTLSPTPSILDIIRLLFWFLVNAKGDVY